MPLPFLKQGQIKIAPFKYTDIEPYGAFANTTGPGHKPIRQTLMVDGAQRVFQWPSSEHAFHAQKILYLKNKLHSSHAAQPLLTEMLNQIEAHQGVYKPREHYDAMVNTFLTPLSDAGLRQPNGDKLNHKHQFDALCDADFHVIHNPTGKKATINFMRTVVALKLRQHEDLRRTAMTCAEEGIFPVEISQWDDNWGAGVNGTGENMLGIIILEEANRLLRLQGKTVAFEDPWEAYKNLRGAVNLSHATMEPKLKPGNGWEFPHGSTTTNNSSLPSHPQRPNLIDKGINPRTRDHYYLDSNTGVTLVVRPDGGHHFSQNRRTINVSPDYADAMTREFNTIYKGNGTYPVQHPNLMDNGVNSRNRDHYYLDKNTGVTLVVRPDGGHHFSQNRQTITVPHDYAEAMTREYKATFKAVNVSSHQATSAVKINYKGTNGTDHYFLDEVTGITLVQRPNGIHFSQNKQKVDVNSSYQNLMIKKVTELKNELKNLYRHSSLDGNSRKHASPVSLDNLEVKGDFHKVHDLKAKYKGVMGDALKTSILLDFKTQLENCNTREDLEKKITEIEASPAYHVLKKGQGITTQLLRLKTSSIDALEKLIKTRRDELPDTGTNCTP
nr:hypothetical protein [Legionella jordanis]